MSSDDNPVIDIKTRKPAERIDLNENTSVAQFMNSMKKYCKDDKVSSIFILTVNEDNHCNWAMLNDNEYQLLLAYATLDDLKREILDEIFPQADIEFD